MGLATLYSDAAHQPVKPLSRPKNRIVLRPGEAEEALGLAVARPETAETVWTGGAEFASGVFHLRQVKAGMEMHWGILNLSSALVASFEEFAPAICFTGTLSGGWALDCRHQGRTVNCGQMAGEMGITRLGSAGVQTELPGKPFVHLTLGVADELVRSWLERSEQPLDEGLGHLQKLVNGEGPLALKMPLSPAVRATIQQAMQCPYRGVARTLAMEARANDLVAGILSALQNESAAAKPRPLYRDDAERIEAAAQILRERLAEPPSLGELARAVGVSDTKLKRGFQVVYGTTAFGYLRSLRMEHARQMLVTGEATVLEAATFVGYSNPSHFAAAFRTEYGVNPKQFQVTAWRRK